MANKREREKRVQEDLLLKYKKSINKLFPLYLVAAAIGGVTLLCYFFSWAYIYNSTPGVGVEVGASGFSYMIAALTGKYSSSSGVYGDIAVPFYYYAGNYCKTLGALTLISMICLIVAVALVVVAFIVKKHEVSLASAVLFLANSVLLLCCFIEALSMKNSRILPIYCNGNPKCSIQSLAIIPFIVSLLSLAANVYATVKYFMIKKSVENKK